MSSNTDEESITKIVGGPVSKQSARNKAGLILGAAMMWNRHPVLRHEYIGRMFYLCQLVGDAVKSRDGSVFEAMAKILRNGWKQEELIIISLHNFLVKSFPNIVVTANELADFVSRELEEMGCESPDESTIRRIAKRIGIPMLPPGRPRKAAKKRSGRRV